jgi:hypothetical protein
MSTFKILPGVSAKFPMTLTRVDRAPEICEQIISMTRLKWQADVSGFGLDGDEATGGPMVPINRRVREGILEIPSVCLKNIIDENPIFLSRICVPPCAIGVRVAAANGAESPAQIETGQPIDVSINLDMAKWLSQSLMDLTNLTLEFCCAKKNLSESSGGDRSDYVWVGQIRKALISGGQSSTSPHLARLIFLNEGDYFISACVSFSRKGEDNDVKEVWWAQKAATIKVIHRDRQ